ncbi:hypothetical protein MMC17_009666 [Xylographa soralifera]|nr:hypothetical protein [Xylographa soralifera]
MEGVVEWQSATPIPALAKRSKDPDWERKQRLREYRVASRREKRNRKADEKKQRKLNATILRRMTRNPDKYTKNAERNRLRAIESERRVIWNEALKQAQRLAAVHDPTGAMFNIGPVAIQEDGSILSLETIRRREEREAAKMEESNALLEITTGQKENAKQLEAVDTKSSFESGINPERWAQIDIGQHVQPGTKMSKSQQRKLAKFEPRPPPPKPIIPQDVQVPAGEENWLDLWDLPDVEIERRVLRTRKRRAAARKALRVKQQSGKVERRAARDEKRKVYRDLKNTWKSIKGRFNCCAQLSRSNLNAEEEKRYKTKLKSAEDEEGKKIAVAITTMERKVALEISAAMGFTISNTEGVAEIKPKALGMKGIEVDFDSLEVGDSLNDVKSRGAGNAVNKTKRRVDLSGAAGIEGAHIVPTGARNAEDPGDFIRLDIGEGKDHEVLNYNHKLRRKLRRAIEAADVKKELLVRERAAEYCKEIGMDPLPELVTPAKPIHLRGERALEDGTLETSKAERVRLRLELAEFNKAARVLRAQAKEIAMEAGLRVYAEMTGRLPPRGSQGNEGSPLNYGPGWVLPEEKPPEAIQPDELVVQ